MQKETSFKHSKDKTCLSYGGPAVFFFKIETYPSVRLDENLLNGRRTMQPKHSAV